MTQRTSGDPLSRYLIAASVGFLVLAGLVMIFSASSVADYVRHADTAYHLKKQLLSAGIGLAVMLALSYLDYRVLRGAGRWVWGISFVGLVLVFVMGVTRWGGKRWLTIGPFVWQPSEMAKLGCVLALAAVIAALPPSQRRFGRVAGPMMWLTFPVALLVMLQPDMGTTMTILISVLLLMWLGGIEKRYLGGVAALGALAVPVMIFAEPYRADRLFAFLDPWKDPQGGGYQIIQALLAFGSGGLSGVGLGLSRQKFFYLPAANTDFVFAIVGEELGLAGTLVMLAAFAALAYAGFRAALKSKDDYGMLVAGGITALIVTQAGMNMCAVTGLMPVTGIPLPFVSYGGSSLILNMGCAGIVMSVARYGGRRDTQRSSGREQSIEGRSDRRGDGRPRLSGIDGGRALRRGA